MNGLILRASTPVTLILEFSVMTIILSNTVNAVPTSLGTLLKCSLGARGCQLWPPHAGIKGVSVRCVSPPMSLQSHR